MPQKIDYHRGRDPCEHDNCKSRLFFEQDGLTFCKQGHQQEGLKTQQDDDDLGTQGRKTRVRRESQEKVSQIYRGHTAVSLFLQSYQLILWRQCHAFVFTIGLPAELESVVKDLWALRLQLVKAKVDATSDEDTVFSSQPQSEMETGKEGGDGKRVWKVRGKAMPSLTETLGVCYLGMVLLRLPVTMGDVHRWAVREDIPYIRAIRFVPAEMRQHLPAEYVKALDTTAPLETDHLRKTIHNLSLFYAHHFKLMFPPLNAPLLLYKHIRNLALPIILHPVVLQISTVLSLSFTFPSPTHGQRISSTPELALISLLVIATKLYHPFDNARTPRLARSLADPGALTINWPAWIQARQAHEARLNPKGNLPRGSEINVTEADVMKMTGEQLDQYMDYYERTFIDPARVESKPHPAPHQLLEMFPTGRLDGSSPIPYSYAEYTENEQSSIGQTLSDVVGGAVDIRPVIKSTYEENDGDEEPVNGIGSFYKRYRTVDELTGTARFFHEKVADEVGVKLETLVVAVGQVERKLIAWREARVKGGLGKDDSGEEKGLGGDGDVEMGDSGSWSGGEDEKSEEEMYDVDD